MRHNLLGLGVLEMEQLALHFHVLQLGVHDRLQLLTVFVVFEVGLLSDDVPLSWSLVLASGGVVHPGRYLQQVRIDVHVKRWLQLQETLHFILVLFDPFNALMTRLLEFAAWEYNALYISVLNRQIVSLINFIFGGITEGRTTYSN